MFGGLDGTVLLWLGNPDVIYTLVVLGIWALVAALAIPGTGFPEVVITLCFFLAFLGFLQVPPNGLGAVLLLLAILLFLLDVKVPGMWLSLVAAVVFAVGSLILFGPDRGVRVSPYLVALATLGTLGVFAVGVKKGMLAQRLPRRSGADLLIGKVGEVRSDLDPAGTVWIAGELWSARAGSPVRAGKRVRVKGVDGLILLVEPIEEEESETFS